MRRKLYCVLCFVAFAMFEASIYANDADSILGLWNTAGGKSKVQIYKCGDKYCGRLTWLQFPTYPKGDEQGLDGLEKVDRHNPVPDLRDRPLVGLDIIKGFIYDGDGTWRNGRIYDPRSGKTYRCRITLTGDSRLLVRGYVGIPLFGKTAEWYR